MKKIGLIIAILPLYAFHPGNKVLNDFPAFKSNSYFKEKVYAEHNWKSFYTLPEPNHTIDPKRYDLHLMNAALFYATNKIREENACKPLAFSKKLRNAAAAHTHQMVIEKFFSHFNSKNKKLYSPEMRIKIFGTKSDITGENCDMNYTEEEDRETYIQVAEKIVKDLYDSPGHRQNMLYKGFSYLGCTAEFVPGDDETKYIKATQDFCGN